MKKAIVICSFLLLLTATAKDLSVLTIGNSFSWSVFRYLPDMVKATPDCNLVLDHANLGGCSLKRHWTCVEKDEAEGTKSYHGGKYSLKDMLTKRKWDIVTLQQVSTESYKIDTFEPYLGKLVEYVRKYAPDAEIVLQETWAYRIDSWLYTKTDIMPEGQKTMYEGIEKAYQFYAKKYGFRVIPTGMAVQLTRQSLPGKFVPTPKHEFKDYKYPNLPKQDYSLCAGYRWKADKVEEGKEKTYSFSVDPNHLNDQGNYIQACTWLAFIFNVNAEQITFLPKEITQENAVIYRKCAQKAVTDAPKVFLTK